MKKDLPEGAVVVFVAHGGTIQVRFGGSFGLISVHFGLMLVCFGLFWSDFGLILARCSTSLTICSSATVRRPAT